ncbi:MAG: hypothetical protein K2G99_01355, partial [Desulfovibrio sp.]|nr:hypothetical protein [Desulfovibrio sp.]
PFRTPPGTIHGWEWERHGKPDIWVAEAYLKCCPFGLPGDRLWVRETFAELPELDGPLFPTDVEYMLAGTPFRWTVKWTPSIHMPRRLARIFLEITEVRVERVQKITEPEALAEGIHASHTGQGPVEAFQQTWDAIYAKRGLGWEVNPWVWVVSFRRLPDMNKEAA